MLVFALNVLHGPLQEYVESIATTNVLWVADYTKASCLQHLSKDVPHIAFLQRGPDWMLFLYLVSKKIAVSIINTEQMTRCIPSEHKEKSEEVAFPFDSFLMRYVGSKMLHSIIDYSMMNIKIWRTLFPHLHYELRCFIPDPLLFQQRTLAKPFNVAFVGDPSSLYRQRILDKVNPLVLVGKYGQERDSELYQYRILLNVHFATNYTIFEELRCLPCVLARMVVVSETSELDTKHPLHKFILFAAYDKLAETIAHTQTNFESIYKTLYVENPLFDTLLQDIRTYQNLQNAALLP